MELNEAEFQEDDLVLKIGCGTAELSRQFVAEGLRPIHVDKDTSTARPLVPVYAADMVNSDTQTLIRDVIDSGRVLCAHLSAPTKTMRRLAENRADQAAKKSTSRVYRDADDPEGRPAKTAAEDEFGLTEVERALCDEENTVARVYTEIVRQCRTQGVLVTVEAPSNNWF